jgi:hypothetical protein
VARVARDFLGKLPRLTLDSVEIFKVACPSCFSGPYQLTLSRCQFTYREFTYKASSRSDGNLSLPMHDESRPIPFL